MLSTHHLPRLIPHHSSSKSGYKPKYITTSENIDKNDTTVTSRPTLNYLLTFVLLGLITGTAAFAYVQFKNKPQETVLHQVTITDATRTENTTEPLSSYRGPVKQATNSVVSINTEQLAMLPPGRAPSAFGRLAPAQKERLYKTEQGSGVIVSEDGYILTNAHVVNDAEQIIVTVSHIGDFMAHIVGIDHESDLAVLKMDAQQTFPAIKFAPVTDMQVGDVVLAIGNPFGVGQTVTMGIISALGRKGVGVSTFEEFIQTDAAINPGNSGGALINIHGELVGINTAIYTGNKEIQASGISFAIPVHIATHVMKQLIEFGHVTRGWLGIKVIPLTRLVRQRLSLDADINGGLITYVYRQSPAHKAGLLPGDIITTIDDQEINAIEKLLNKSARYMPGTWARVDFIRQGKPMQTTLQVGARPIIQ